MQMTKLTPARIRIVRIAFSILIFISIIFRGLSYASEKPQPESRYNIVGPVYLSGIYRNLNNRQLNKQMAYGTLTAVRFSGPEVAFQYKVPVGTIMTIIRPAPQRLPLPFYANRYFVRLDPTDVHSELDVVLELNRGIEGSLDGLNPELFGRK
jgi:hypothetical protein